MSYGTQRGGLDGRGWRDLLARRGKDLADRVQEYGSVVATTSTMLGKMNDPPLGWGTGRWERAHRVLATVLPTGQEMFRGDWIGGLHGQEAESVAVFAMKRKIFTTPGNYAELEVKLPISGNRQRLALMLCLSNVNKDAIGLDFVPARWCGYQSIQLLQADQVLWEADLGWPREAGEWFVVKLPAIPEDQETLVLRLRVDVHRMVLGYGIAYVGPIRLLELAE